MSSGRRFLVFGPIAVLTFVFGYGLALFVLSEWINVAPVRDHGIEAAMMIGGLLTIVVFVVVDRLMTRIARNRAATADASQPARPHKTRRIILRSLAAIFGLVALRVLWLVYCLAVGGRPATISTETTYVLGPLRPDGTVDYLAAINQRASIGVTPENNAAVPLMQVLGYLECSGHGSDARCARLLAALGTVPLPISERYHGYYDFFTKDKRHTPTENPSVSIEEACKAPWPADRYPWLADAIRANDSALDRIVLATGRTKYFVPRLAPRENGTVVELSMSDTFPTRDIAQMLAARAMYRLGQGDKKHAAGDLLACHRLSRLLDQQLFVITRLIARSADLTAYDAEAVLFFYGGLSQKELADYRQKLAGLPPPGSLSRSLVGDRLVGLDLLTSLVSGRPDMNGFLSATGQRGNLLMRFLDVDEMLRAANATYNELDVACSLPTYAERKAAVTRLRNDLDRRMAEATSGLRQIQRVVLGTEKQASRDMADRVSSIDVHPIDAFVILDERFHMHGVLTDVALALAEYRAEHAEYPADLAALVPKFLDKVPLDTFVDRPVIYRRTQQGFVLKSVGPDGIEWPAKNKSDSDDIVIEMPVPAPK